MRWGKRWAATEGSGGGGGEGAVIVGDIGRGRAEGRGDVLRRSINDHWEDKCRYEYDLGERVEDLGALEVGEVF